MKRFKKLAAGMVAAGMALAMLPVAAAQAANMRTLTIETKVAGRIPKTCRICRLNTMCIWTVLYTAVDQ